MRLALLCAAAICLAGVLAALFYDHHGPPPKGAEAENGTQAADAALPVLQEEGSGISGAEVKRELEALAEADGRAVILATRETLAERIAPETAYLLYGINYGCVLEQQTLYSMGPDAYQIIGGFLDADVLAERKDYAQGTAKTVVGRKKFHPYEAAEMEIADDSQFARRILYDSEGQEVSSFYTFLF